MENKTVRTVREESVMERTQEMADDLVQRAGMETLRERQWRSLPGVD